ncbi:hypothetical protein [Chryseobacterium jejuense]|uniref:hypothetical protein n=1 Tax=Chryseobacterium jejuense TaxID=445960 RepID=UPI001AE7169C|nr:hypothetical protein [Chryseobacterium jejuense]MBP2618853.1 hypothetical protein [Chryseobacterium jejuense]
MKKSKVLWTVAILSINHVLLAQVGINTPNPRGVLHVDGKKDNPATGAPSAAQQANDFVVTSSGSIGIGTTAPSAKIEIQTGGTATVPTPGFKLVDGNQKEGRMLMSDANGLGTWQSLTNKNITVWEMGGNTTLNMDNTSNNTFSQERGKGSIVYDNLGATNDVNSINVPPGRYLIFITHDISGFEYGQFQLKSNNNNIFNTFYGEWLNGTAFANLTAPVNNLTVWFLGSGYNPNTTYYKTEYNAINHYIKLVFFRLGE